MTKMPGKRAARWLSYLLVAGGAVLTFLGAQAFFESRLGQADAAREFDRIGAPRSSIAIAPRRGDVLARLAIPRLDTELFVIEGGGERELRRGPGHLAGTVLPGAAGNCVIAGHRDTHFRVLKDIRVGDEIVLATEGRRFVYRVKGTSVVSPRNTSALQPTADAELNLITCFPFYYVGSAPKRFVVRAQLDGPAPGHPRS